MSDSEKLLRFQTRLNESNAMKLDDLDFERSQWRKDIEAYNQKLKDDERERVFNAIRKVWLDGFRWDLSGEDLIQSIKLHMKKKDK